MRYFGAPQVLVVLQVDGGGAQRVRTGAPPAQLACLRMGSWMSRYAVRTSWLSGAVAHIVLS